MRPEWYRSQKTNLWILNSSIRLVTFLLNRYDRMPVQDAMLDSQVIQLLRCVGSFISREEDALVSELPIGDIPVPEDAALIGLANIAELYEEMQNSISRGDT